MQSYLFQEYIYIYYNYSIHLLKTRLLGWFVPIFYFNCEHFFFVYIVKQKPKKFADFIKKNVVDFENLLEIDL